jgi:hypothetical protein
MTSRESVTSIVEVPVHELKAHTLQFMGLIGLRLNPYYQLTLVEAHQRSAAEQAYGLPAYRTGKYFPQSLEALTLEETYPGMPITARTELAAGAVHESTHHAQPPPENSHFYAEAMAGLVELAYLTRLRAIGVIRTAGSYRAHMSPPGESSFTLTIPGECRYLDAREDTGSTEGHAETAYTGTGLIAALGLAYGLEASGITPQQVIRAGQTRPSAAYAVIDSALRALDPTMSHCYRGLSENRFGIAQATAAIQEVAETRKITPDLSSLYRL